MIRLLIRLAVNAIALWAAFQIVPGLEHTSETGTSLIIIALIFGLVNALVRPIIILMTCPLIILSLGFFVVIINTIMLSLTIWLAGPEMLNLGLSSTGFWATFFGAIVISFVSSVINLLIKDNNERDDNKSVIIEHRS
ncbi:MAG: phage holin family protein [Chloroflexi bacterium]|nr:MAG: phage holin family protein [Chloroflexota bacterium]